MTRKKYSADTYYEELEKEFIESSSDEEEEVPKLTEEEKYDIVCYYIDEACWNIDWIQKWIDPTTLLNIIENIEITSFDYNTLLMNFDEQSMASRLYDIVYHMCDTLLLKPTNKMVYSIVVEMLSVRNKYEHVLPRTQTHWTARWSRVLTKSHNNCIKD